MAAQQYLASLASWDCVKRLDPLIAEHCDKDDLMAAEVRLPVAAGTDMSMLKSVQVRPPYQRASRLLLVDVSRLPAP